MSKGTRKRNQPPANADKTKNNGVESVEVSFAEEQPLFAELAVSGGALDITKGYADTATLEILPHELLQMSGVDGHTVADSTLADPQVWAGVEQRRNAGVATEWDVTPGGEDAIDIAAAESISRIFKNFRFDAARGHLGYTTFYGYSVAEFMWRSGNGEIEIEDIKVRDRRRFRIAADGSVRMLTINNPSGIELPECKFLSYTSGGTHSNESYGIGLASRLHWLVHFKRHMMKYWLIHLEKYGSPTALGTFPAEWVNLSTGQLNIAARKFLQSMRAIQTDASVIIPDNTTVDTLNSARSGGSSHKEFLDSIDKLIAKVTVGQTLTLDSDGGQYKADVHKSILDGLIKSDLDDMFSALNESAVKWLTDWNYPGAAYPKIWPILSDPADLDAMAERDVKLSSIGYLPSQERINEIYGPGYVLNSSDVYDVGKDDQDVEDIGIGSDKESEEIEFEELQANLLNDEDTFDRALDIIGAAEFPVDMRAELQPILDKIRTDGPDSVRDNIASLYPEMDTTTLEAQIARFIFLSDIFGRVMASNGR